MDNFYKDFISSEYKTYRAQQHPNVWETFEKFLKNEKFDIILEIGTGLGGFTEFIHDLGYKIISYDIEDIYDTHKKLIDKGVDIRHENVFDPHHTILQQDFENYLKQGRVLVLCDGCEKHKEFNLISKHIKSNDVIMGHDYCVDEKTFESLYKDKEWKYLELLESDLDTTNLIPYKQDTFDGVFWVCKIKTDNGPNVF